MPKQWWKWPQSSSLVKYLLSNPKYIYFHICLFFLYSGKIEFFLGDFFIWSGDLCRDAFHILCGFKAHKTNISWHYCRQSMLIICSFSFDRIYRDLVIFRSWVRMIQSSVIHSNHKLLLCQAHLLPYNWDFWYRQSLHLQYIR